MAVLDGDAALTAIRDRIAGRLSSPSVRAIPPGYFGMDLPEGTDDDTAAIRALPNPIPGRTRPQVTVTGGLEPSEASPSGPSNIAILKLTAAVRIRYNLGNPAESEANYQRTAQQAVSDADRIRQALIWPGSLRVTAAGASTGIVSGILMMSSPMRVTRQSPDGAGDLLVTDVEYQGDVVVTQAIT